MKKLLVLLFSILISFNSYGEWKKIGYSNEGNTFFIEIDTIKEHGGYKYSWDLSDYLVPSKFGDLSVQIYKQIDCGVSRFKNLSFIFFKQNMGKGENRTFNPSESEWQYPGPGTIAKSIINYACTVVEEQVDDQLIALKFAYVNNIAARVKTFWRYQGAEDNWGCDVYVLQSIEGVVEAVDVQNCTLDDSEKARAFKDSIERAVYKSSPLPSAPDDAVFNKEILFRFKVN